MTEKDQEGFSNPTKCWICKNAYKEGEVKVKDYNHITGKCRRSTHQEYSLSLGLSKKFPVAFHNFQNQKLENVISKTIERNISFTIKPPERKGIKLGLSLAFIDGVHFLNNSLNNLVKNLRENYFYHLS